MCCHIIRVHIYLKNESSYTVIKFYQKYVIFDVHVGRLYELSRLSCKLYVCYPVSHIPVHLENEWSYLLINVCQQYGMLNAYIGCLYELSQLSVQSWMYYPSSHVLINLENEWSHWSTFINRMVYYMHILDAYVNDLTSLFNHKHVSLLHMALYILKTNDLTYRWTFINSTVY